MKIAHISDCYLPRVGGIETNVSELAEQQRSRGHDVTIITSTQAGSTSTQAGSTSTQAGITSTQDGMTTQAGAPPDDVTVIRVDPSTTHPGRIRYLHSPRVRSLVVDGRYDVVHVHASAWSPLAYVAAHHAGRHRIPVVLTVHSLWAGATPIFHVCGWFTRLSDWPVEWTAVSRAASVAVRSVLSGPARVAIVPNGVDPDRWRVTPIPGPPNQLRIATVGRLAPRKRTMHLARVLLDVRRRLPGSIHLSVQIVGDGPERGALEHYLRRHGMTGWVRLRGALDRDQIRAVFADSDLFIAPAVLESFGIAALEARCAGLPVLARAGTGIEEYIDDGVHGWLVGSDRAMSDTLTDLALNHDRLEQVTNRVRDEPAAIDWTMVLDRYEAVYRTAAARYGTQWPDPALKPRALVQVSPE